MIHSKYTSLRFGAVLLTAMAANACGDGDNAAPVVRPGGVIIDRTNQPLNLGEMVSIGGTYGANCDERTGSWVLGVGPNAVDSTLSVLAAEADCTLNIVSITASDLAPTPALTTYTTSTPIVLLWTDENYFPGEVAAFEKDQAPDGIEFYGNAKRTPIAGGAGGTFSIEFSFSEDPDFEADPVMVPVADTFGITGSEMGIAPPTYTLDPGLTFDTFTDTTTETQVMGSALLADTMPIANPAVTATIGYVITATPVAELSTFAEVDAEFTLLAGAADVNVEAIFDPITGGAINDLIEVAVEPDLTAVAVIIADDDLETGVRTYQVIELSFVAPAPLAACNEGEPVAGCDCSAGQDVLGFCEIALESCADDQDMVTDNCNCDSPDAPAITRSNVNNICTVGT